MPYLKSRIKTLGRDMFTKIGRFRPLDADPLPRERGEAVGYVGDLPPHGGLKPIQHRELFRAARPTEKVPDLIYTPRGVAWVGGTLRERMGQHTPSLRDIWNRPRRGDCLSLPGGTIIQCETLYSYGDWVSEFVASLTAALPLSSPLLVPPAMLDKPYARRELDDLGVEVIRVDRPIHLDMATVLYKSRPMHYWTRDEIAAYRRAFRVPSGTPRPGSAIYLSREGERGESGFREYPSQQVAEILEPLGVRVVRARETSREQYMALADEAETVIADHGAAMFNMLLWNPKRVIELFNGAWWNNCFLFLAKGLGVDDYRLLNVDRVGSPGIADDFRRYLAEPITPR